MYRILKECVIQDRTGNIHATYQTRAGFVIKDRTGNVYAIYLD